MDMVLTEPLTLKPRPSLINALILGRTLLRTPALESLTKGDVIDAEANPEAACNISG